MILPHNPISSTTALTTTHQFQLPRCIQQRQLTGHPFSPVQEIVTERIFNQYNAFLTPLQLTLRTMAVGNVIQQLPPSHAPVRV